MCGAEQAEVEGVDEGVCGAEQVEVEGVDGGVCGAEQVEGVDEGACGAGQVEVEGLLSTTSRRARLLSRPAILSRRERGLVSSGRDALNMQASNMQGTIEGGTQGTVEGDHTGYRRGR